MDERVLQFRVGVVVVASAIITVILVMLFGAWPSVWEGRYEIHVTFPEAPGITVDAPVRKSGVLIGRVSNVKLQDEGGVLVSMRIFDQFKLRRHETCRIGTGSLLGDAVVEFVPSGKDERLARFDANRDGKLDEDEERTANELLADTEYMSDGVVVSNPLRALVNLEGSVSSAFRSLEGAGKEVSQLARSVNQAVGGGDDQIRRIMQKTEVALDHFDQTMQAVEKILGDEQLAGQLRQTIQEIPAFVDETRQTMAAARTTMDHVREMSDKAKTNLDHLEKFTKPLGESGPQLVANVEESTRNLNDLLEQFVAFSEALNSGQGTLGRLVHDDEVYQQIQRVVGNAEEITRRARPIVEDVRIFTDKIARDPRQLGVKGALDQRPSGLKTGLGEW
ncbi:MAG TPA: MlaD family protein [Candidatus Anammoximicrobium sp.]|nr:MlaD family protein [Candidatus Anammoximicrobium sp.]